MICPKCGGSKLSENSIGDKVLCLDCSREFELTPINTWYKDTVLVNRNIEYNISV